MIEFNRSYHLVPQTNDAVKIKIVGIGGAGSNALDRIVLDGANGAEIVVMNTDVQSLTSSVANEKVQLGREATRGLGAGGDPEVGQSAAEEAADEIRNALDGTSMVFICVGLGGGTGSGAAPLVAGMAKEQGALVVVFATMPFSFEGKRRAKQAEEAMVALEATADAVICFENDTLGDAVSPKAGIHQAFAAADETISQSVRAVSNLFARPGILHIGFDDLRAALRTNAGGAGRCLFGFGEAEGDNRAHEALARALKNPLMDRGRMLDEAHNVLVNVSGGPDMTMSEVQILMEELGRHLGENTQVLFGTAVDPKMGESLSVTIISSVAVGASPVEVKSVAAQHVNHSVHAPATPTPEPWRASSNGNGSVTHSQIAPVETPQPAETEAVIESEPLNEFIETGSELTEAEPVIEALPPLAPLTQQQTAKASKPAPEVAAVVPKREERQETLQFEPVTRGRFEKSEPTIVDGQDLDVPTFLRRNIRVK